MCLPYLQSSQRRKASRWKWCKEHDFHDLASHKLQSMFFWVHISIEILPHLVFETEFRGCLHRFSAYFPSIDVACCRWPWQPTPPTTATQRLAANPMRKPSEFRDCPEIFAVPSATARAAAQVMCQKVTAPLLSVLSEPPRVTSTALWFASLTLTAVSELHEDVLVFWWLSRWKIYNLVAEGLLDAMHGRGF